MAGARKRKAGKKKGKNGDAQNPNNQQHSSNSSTHSQGSDDPKFADDRESDSGEVEREEVENREVEGEGAVDYEEGRYENGKELVEEAVEITKEAIAGVFGKAKHEENGSGDVDSSAVGIANETPVQVLITEDNVPVDGGAQDDEVAVEKEKSIVAELEEANGEVVPPVSMSVFGHEVPKPAVELMKDVVSLPQEMNAEFGSLIKLDAVHPELIKNADTNSLISGEEDKISSAMDDLPSEEIETKASSIDEDKPLDGLPVEVGSLENAGNTFEAAERVEEHTVAPAVTITQVVESLKSGEALGRLDDQVGSVKEVGTEQQAIVESVKNGETLKLLDENVNSKVVTANCEVANVKEIETQKRSVEQPSTGSNPLPIRRTSWFGCCGISELFSSAYR